MRPENKHNVKAVAMFLNQKFDRLNAKTKKVVLLSLSMLACAITLTIIVNSPGTALKKSYYANRRITQPKDIYMNTDQRSHLRDELIPVGKMKGEMNGEFDAFYLAVDQNGVIFLNRSLEYSNDAYLKSKGWKPVSRKELEQFGKELHFIPIRNHGLKP